MAQTIDCPGGLHLENQLNIIRESQNDLLNAAPTSILITDPYQRITFANKAFEVLTGYSQQEVFGKDYKILHGPETDLEQAQAIRDSLKEARLFFGETLTYKKDGSRFWNELTISPLFCRENKLSYFIWILRDISENKLLIDSLIESERRFRELSDANPALILQVDIHKSLFWVNKSWLSFTGRSYFNEQGMGWINGVHPQDRDNFLNSCSRSFECREKFHIEYRLQRADGKYRWLNGHYFPQYSAEGEFIGYVGTCIDITEVRNSRAALDFFNVAHEIIYSTDLNRIILDCNQRFCELTGYSKEEVIGQNVSILKSGMHDTNFYSRMWQKINNDNSWQGEFINRTKSGDLTTIMTTITVIYDGNKPQRYLAVGSDITNIVSKREYYQKIAYYDNLTGLPNRFLLLDRLNNIINNTKNYGGFFAVLFIDLDGFKRINDHYGHALGDKFLVFISNQMKKVIRKSDTLARLGGDEFIIILDGLTGKHDYEGTITKLLYVCSSDILLEGVSLKVTASIGVCVYPNDMPDEDIDAKLILNYADQAMYVAKRKSKNSFHYFDRIQDQIIVTRNNAIEGIKAGLLNEEFKLYYQPKVNMRTGQVLGFEALIRWNKDKSELLEPSQFLPLVQNHPLGIELGNWVIKTALAQLSQWHMQGLTLSLSVNMDIRQLMQPYFFEYLQDEINNLINYQAGSFVLEILETTEIEDRLRVSEIINRCRALGVDFYLDDFGTGYSSITYLKELPLNTLKIDRSFIADITRSNQDLQLVANIIRLANDLDKKLIAEGVETIEQGLLLINLGCEIGQGYAIAKPMPSDEVLSWVSDWQPESSWTAASKLHDTYRFLFEQMNDPTLIIKDGHFIDCNDAAIKLLGYTSKASFLKQSPCDISPVHQPDGLRSEDKAEQILKSALREGNQCFEWLHVRADRSEVLVEVMLTPIKLNDEWVIHTVWRDLSYRR
jgi:diguanylate cyclase (GGDEF)-like protein/PAS domain S-box-containing protein